MRRTAVVLLALAACTTAARAQQVVPVEDEPLHREVFRRPAGRVLDIRLAPGQSTLYHEHGRDYFWLGVAGSGFLSVRPGMPADTVRFARRALGFTAGSAAPLVHQVINAPDSLHIVSLELDPEYLASCPARPAAPRPALPGQVMDTSGVRVQQLELAAGDTLRPAGRGPSFMVALTPTSLRAVGAPDPAHDRWTGEPGQFLWQQAPVPAVNTGTAAARVVLFSIDSCPA